MMNPLLQINEKKLIAFTDALNNLEIAISEIKKTLTILDITKKDYYEIEPEKLIT